MLALILRLISSRLVMHTMSVYLPTQWGKIMELNVEAYQYLMNIELSLWARFKFDPVLCSPDNTNNFTESFNATLGLDTVKPILTLAEGVRRSCMIRIAKRQEDVEEWNINDVTPFCKI